jgi:hypothetical protein
VEDVFFYIDSQTSKVEGSIFLYNNFSASEGLLFGGGSEINDEGRKRNSQQRNPWNSFLSNDFGVWAFATQTSSFESTRLWRSSPIPTSRVYVSREFNFCITRILYQGFARVARILIPHVANWLDDGSPEKAGLLLTIARALSWRRGVICGAESGRRGLREDSKVKSLD